MRDLIKQEQFEIEVLAKLNSRKLLSGLVFIGGTMLRLCHGLERFSVDLDFWLKNKDRTAGLFGKIKDCLKQAYTITDAADKFNTWLFEIKSPAYPRRLKIEIRKNARPIKTEPAIAYSRLADGQVLLKAATLEEMMKMKIEAFLDRGEIRDIFDLEFLVKKGVDLKAGPETVKKVLKGIAGLTVKDYAVKLGSLLEEPLRGYYRKENFKILKAALGGESG